MIGNIVLVLIAFPIPFALYGVWRDYLVRGDKGELFKWCILTSLPIFSFIGMLEVFLYKNSDDKNYFLGYKKHLNEVSNCYECGITSRLYQLTNNGYNNKCPHCESVNRMSYYSEDDKVYPFAPKLSEIGIIKYLLNRNKLDKIKQDLEETERIDKEIEAYEKLQLMKLKEYEEKANKIKAELKLKEN